MGQPSLPPKPKPSYGAKSSSLSQGILHCKIETIQSYGETQKFTHRANPWQWRRDSMTQCGWPSASNGRGEQRQMGERGEVGGREEREGTRNSYVNVISKLCETGCYNDHNNSDTYMWRQQQWLIVVVVVILIISGWFSGAAVSQHVPVWLQCELSVCVCVCHAHWELFRGIRAVVFHHQVNVCTKAAFLMESELCNPFLVLLHDKHDSRTPRHGYLSCCGSCCVIHPGLFPPPPIPLSMFHSPSPYPQ